ncbi:MAG TPA: 30S ribosomal protein S8 [Kiritimatiellia bacterium]|nr:30S ribosomal protein S8 [Kiritimatiellia bacterium]HNR93200.1 30S ribosomal protein S8 [Kiritimatiellia bacterium]HNS81168.1 30S ribosomal protein S8 [Kiritimatiellia bacterium]HPA77595.1 30S ribosomal protein S8 [Kiritimatiellia bacterium]HQQ03633.1 30S ribosomal protein S8 [Kiritimatiellia bacterium]
MSLSDPIADMLTRIRNASAAGAKSVEIPHSRMKEGLARILKQEGYISDYTVSGEGARKGLRIRLKYVREGDPVITGLRRVSRPSLRRYVAATEIPRVLGGMGIAVISTSSGVMTGHEARKKNVGGELLCTIW